MISPGRQELELDVFVLALGTLALIVLASEVRRIAPSAHESLLEQALAPEPPEVYPIAELHRLDRELTMSSTRAFDLHYQAPPSSPGDRGRAARTARHEPRFGLSVGAGRSR